MLEELILEATRAVKCPSANPADLTQTFKREVLDRDEFYIFGKHGQMKCARLLISELDSVKLQIQMSLFEVWPDVSFE